MKTRKTLFVSVFLLAAWLLSACGAAATQAPAVMEAPAATEFAAATEAPVVAEAPPADESAQKGMDGNVVYNIGQPEPTVEGEQSPNTLPEVDARATTRMIIKNAEMRLKVADSDVAIDGVTQVVGDVGGYIISSRVWYQDWGGKNYKYATISVGVPVTQFETAMRRLRGLSITVLDENASGEDVSNQYVDLQSQVQNLEATRERIKGFLDQAKTVDEAMQVNQQLTEIERQIEELKGRMNYLSDRSAYSTITVNLEPDLPPIITPTPTVVPTATPEPWDPSKTFGEAKRTVTSAYQGFVDIAIWLFLVVIPILAPPLLIIWGSVKLFRRKPNKPA